MLGLALGAYCRFLSGAWRTLSSSWRHLEMPVWSLMQVCRGLAAKCFKYLPRRTSLWRAAELPSHSCSVPAYLHAALGALLLMHCSLAGSASSTLQRPTSCLGSSVTSYCAASCTSCAVSLMGSVCWRACCQPPAASFD